MTRGEKITAWTVGLVMFTGLFYSIFTLVRAPVSRPGDEFFSDAIDEEEDFEFETSEGESGLGISTAAPFSPSPAKATPSSSPAKSSAERRRPVQKK